MTAATTFSGFQYKDSYNSVGYLNQIADATSGTVYWTANSMDAYGHLTQETAGNGVVTSRAFWPESGRIEQIYAQTGSGQQPPSGTDLVNLSYSWDSIGNLLTRDDTVNGVAENFCYLDNASGTANVLNRLSNYSVNSSDNSCADGSIATSMSYDNDGNITNKSDVGTYSYSGAGPHAVTSIASCSGCNVNGQTNPTFSYDADGNMTADAGRALTYTSFDMAETVTQGTQTGTFGYDPEHNRASLSNSVSGATVWYFNNPAAGVATEYVPGTPVWRDYLRAYGHIVAERFVAGSTVSMSYFVGDHLASTTVLADANGNQQEYDSYDVWGKRRKPNGNGWNGCFASNPKSLTLRGYTGEEMLDTYCLVNLNARLYDPSIGRMLSADPTVPNPMSGQSFNRFSYVYNQPLSLTDPTGLAGFPCASEDGCKVVYIGGNGQGTDGADVGDGPEEVDVFGTPNPWADPNWAGGQFDLEQYMGDAQQVGGSVGSENGQVETVVVTANRINNAITAMNAFNLQFALNSLQSMSFEVSDGKDSSKNSSVCSKVVTGVGNVLRATGQLANIGSTSVLGVGVGIGVLGAPESGGVSFGVTFLFGSAAYVGYQAADDLDLLGAFFQSAGSGDPSYQNEAINDFEVEAQNETNAGPAAPIVSVTQSLTNGVAETFGDGPPMASCH